MVLFWMCYFISYNVVVHMCPRVKRTAVQWAVVSSSCLPMSVEVISHDVHEVKETKKTDAAF